MENLTAATIDAERRTDAILRHAARRLVAAGIESGARDAEVLLGHALGIGREQLIARLSESIDERHARAYERLLLRRLEREPTAYIIRAREFWSLAFEVTREVLIPRPETELLVESTLRAARQHGSDAPLKIADIGTGSGAIAVALASELAHAEIFATDISASALSVARGNAERNHLSGRIHFVVGDLFAALPQRACFDIIVSNPPYIRSGDIGALQPEVSRCEPRAALDGGADGLDFYRRIALHASPYLTPTGVLLVEIGARTGETVAQLFHDAGGWGHIAIAKDYAGQQRVVSAHKIGGAQ